MMLTIEQIKQTVSDYFKDKPVKHGYLFGSYARGEADENSDVDLLVKLDDQKKISLFEFIKLQMGLEDVLSKNVELVEEKLIYHRLLPYIQRDKIKIFEV